MPQLSATLDPSGSQERMLAAVIITRNEEQRVGRCIESVLESIAETGSGDVVLVDSGSTDRTLEIALQHPILVAQIRRGVRCTAALGRSVGQYLTNSQYLLFVDGDTEINPEWVVSALNTLTEHPDIAGVGGKLKEVYYFNGAPVGETDDFFKMGNTVEDAYQLGGNAIYRRAALESVPINPGVVSHEEAELAARLRQAGYRLARIPLTIGVHHTPARDTWQECWRRFRSGLLVGCGQVLRLSIGSPALFEHARQLNRYLLALLFLLIGLGTVIKSLVSTDATYLLIWTVLAISLAVTLAVRTRGLRKALLLIVEWTLSAPAILFGFMIREPVPRCDSLDQLFEIVSDRRKVFKAMLTISSIT